MGRKDNTVLYKDEPIMKIRGFTLVETVIGMTAGAAVALMVFMLLTPAQNWLFTQTRRAGINENQTAVARIVSEINRIKSPAQIQNNFSVSNLQFVDIDNNAVTIQQSGTNILLNGDVLASNVQAFSLLYYDEDGNPIIDQAAPIQIRVIELRLEITCGSQLVRLQSSARIRNLQ